VDAGHALVGESSIAAISSRGKRMVAGPVEAAAIVAVRPAGGKRRAKPL
jgi:hypothetical protein